LPAFSPEFGPGRENTDVEHLLVDVHNEESLMCCGLEQYMRNRPATQLHPKKEDAFAAFAKE